MLPKMLSYIRRHGLMRPGDRVGVAVSGGADSVALLRLLLDARAELGIVLSIVHFNHKIRGAHADADEQFVRQLAQQHTLEFHGSSADVPAHAGEKKLGLEAAARELRYQFFNRLLKDTLDRIATAHTLDDQAETVLLRFLRGAGTRGLAGIYPQLAYSCKHSSTIVRPLLEHRRRGLREYLQSIQQPWREDATNRDLSYARNRVRHELLPMLERAFNPGIADVLSETAEIARAEEEYWEELVRRAAPIVMPDPVPGSQALRTDALLAQPLAVQRRLVRTAAAALGVALEFRHVEQVLDLARSPASRTARAIELPQGWHAVRSHRELRFRRGSPTPQQSHDYDFSLPVPGKLDLPTLHLQLRASLLPAGSPHPVKAVLLDPAKLTAELRVRNWRPGDRYHPAHSSAPRKLKELLHAPHIPRAQKPFWPVVVCGDCIVWVPGFPAPEQFRPRNEHPPALLLEQLPLAAE